MADIDDIMDDEVAQMGAGATAIGVASTVPAISSTVTTATGMIAGTKAGAVLGTLALGLGAAPVIVIGGGLKLIGIGIARVLRK